MKNDFIKTLLFIKPPTSLLLKKLNKAQPNSTLFLTSDYFYFS